MTSPAIDSVDINPMLTAEGVTDELSAWLHSCRLEDVPHSIQTRVKLLLLDAVACAIVGSHLPWSETAVEAVLRLESSGNNTLIGWDRNATASGAVLLNSTFIQGFELDDFHILAPIHGSSIVLPVLLAAAHEIGSATGSDLLMAAVLGFEVGPRVGLALHGAQMLSRGWHSGPVFGTFSAAATAGKLLHLGREAIADSLGMAATQSAGLTGARFGAMCKRMQHGFATRDGFQAAFLAAGGYTGIRSVFDLKHGGFLSVYGEGHAPVPQRLTKGLGTIWEIDRIITKTYPVMGGIHAPLDALFEIGRKRELAPSTIGTVTVKLPRAAFHHGGWPAMRPLTPVSAQMNVAYCVAVAILDGVVALRQFGPSRIERDDIWEILPKIKVEHDPELDESGPAGQGQTRVEVCFTDGLVLSEKLQAAHAVTRPLDQGRVVEKFHGLTDGLIEAHQQKTIIDCFLNLENLPSIDVLERALTGDVACAF